MGEKNLFRLASMMYLHLNNKDITNKKIIKKVIESVLMDLENKSLSIEQIEIHIKEEYGIIITEKELNESIKKYPSNYSIDCTTNKIKLKQDRFEYLLTEFSKNGAEEIVDLFIFEYNTVIKKIGLSNKKIKDSLYKFFHALIGKSQKQIENIVTNKSIDQKIIEEFEESESKVINLFLTWKNIEKSELIYKMYNLGIEYSLLTVPNVRKNLPNILKGKKIYIDANIIFRIIGVNGEGRKKRMETFLKKCKDTEQELFISKYTEDEFRNVIDFYINKISKHASGKYINGNVYKRMNFNDGMYSFYNQWCENNKDMSIDKFRIDIQVLYKKFLKKYDVKINYSIDFEETKEYLKQKEKIQIELMSHLVKEKTDSGIAVDIDNIYLINSLRGVVNQALTDTKYYMVSADKSMINWNIVGKQPHSIYPSLWLSIMLKSGGRTEDDLRSFTDFLKLKVNESIFTDYEVFLISQGVSSLVTDSSSQKQIINQMIENSFNKEISGRKNTVEKVKKIKEFTEDFQEQMIKKKDNEIDTMKKIHEEEKNRNDSIEKNKNDEIDSIKRKHEVEKEELYNIRENLKTKIKKDISLKLIISFMSYVALTIYFIYYFGWDTMEPITYIISLIISVGGYIYLVATYDELKPKEILDKIFKSKLKKEYEKLVKIN